MSLIAVSTLLAATVGPVMFGTTGKWVALSRSGEILAAFSKFGGMDAIDATISPDAKTVVFTAWNDEAGNRLLYKWVIGAESATLLGESQGFHASPDFTNDGKWVYFAHHPRKGGPPGQHEPGANAQLYRVQVDGRNLQALTDESGCHMHPNAIAPSLIVYSHTSCIRGRSVKLFDGHKSSQGLQPGFGEYDVAVLDQFGKRIAFVMHSRVDFLVLELDLRTSTTKELFRFSADGPIRLAYSSSGDIMYQDTLGVEVWSHSGELRRLTSFGDLK